MRAQLRHWIDRIRTGFWFVPVVMLLLSGGLALLLLWVDRHLDPGMEAKLRWAYSGGPEGARSLLSTVAGSMITAASVTFSLASVALSIASQQYGSRVLRNFMRDSVTQVLLGTFLSTFLYCVLVVRTIRGSDYSGGFVPSISVTVAILMSIVSLVMLVYFVHHVSTSIQASHIVRVIAEDLADAIPQLYPTRKTEPRPRPVTEDWRTEDWRTWTSVQVPAAESGYLESIDLESLLELACNSGGVIELLVRPGDHLLRGQTIAQLRGNAQWPDKQRKRLQHAFLFSGARTPEQDIRYTFQQLTDVVVRALSPGINDPFTAINGIDELAASAQLMARSPRPATMRTDATGVPRLYVPATGIAEILEKTVGHIAIYAAADHFVTDGLRRVLDVVDPSLEAGEEQATAARLRTQLDRREAETAGNL